jgi:hypothetical protein
VVYVTIRNGNVRARVFAVDYHRAQRLARLVPRLEHAVRCALEAEPRA